MIAMEWVLHLRGSALKIDDSEGKSEYRQAACTLKAQSNPHKRSLFLAPSK